MPISREKSPAPVIHVEDDGDWDYLLKACGGMMSPHDLAKFRSHLGKPCKTIVVEKNYVCKDYRDTYTNFYAKKFATYPDKCTRLLFFSDRMDAGEWWAWWDDKAHRDSFIGYSIIRPNRISCIGRTILEPKYCEGVQGDMCLTEYTSHFMGVELTVRGFPYISQDTDVTICAHAACWMSFRYFSERYPTYREIFPYEITQLTQDLSEGRLIPSAGLTMSQVVEIFSRYGFHPRFYLRRKWSQDNRFERLLYSYIESGIPLVIGLPDHAVTAIGHTSDYTISPGAGLTYSSDFVTGIVVNDDNYLPYQTIPAQIGQLSGHISSTFSISQIDSFVVPLYEKVYLAAEDVERLSVAILQDKEFGIAKNSALPIDDVVVRIFLTTSRSYKKERRVSPPPHNLDMLYTQLTMPKFIWVCEISSKSAYPQGKILGEILWDATAARQDFFAWLVIHYPETAWINDRTNMYGGVSKLHFPLPVEYDLYRHNLQPVP